MDKINLILEKIRSEGFLEEIISEKFEKQLDLELKKSSPDYDLVDELTKTILETRGKIVKEIDVKPEIQAIRQGKIKRIRFPKWAISLSAACFIMFCANCISVSAWDMNIVSAVIEFTKGGFSVDFGKNEYEVIELPTSENDPYGLIAECAKYEIYPETPHYLPEGFELTLISNNVNKDYANIISFTFKNSDMSISLDYKRYWNGVTNTLIPSDNYNISEIEINGKSAIVSKEDNQFTVHYIEDDTAYVIFTQNVPYDECDKIVSSIK
ncbi:MAG: DUF4367 domain-containing protein [Ruminococcus sp.]|nr:DUF4367 domain-containing protein [Ruminococcus sp.]